MATWNITVPARSNQAFPSTGSDSISSGRPSDFDGATINSVTVSGSPTVTFSAGDDGIGVRWHITTSGGASTHGSLGTNTASMCHANMTTGNTGTSDAIAVGSSPSPEPTTATAADWDSVAFELNEDISMKDDSRLATWSAFTIVVDYTPGAVQRSFTYSGSGTPSTLGIEKSFLRSLDPTGTGAAELAIRPRVWLNSTATKTGADEMTVTSYNLDGTSITFSDPSGGQTGSLQLGVENLKTGLIGWIAVTVNADVGTQKSLTYTGSGGLTLTREVGKLNTYTVTGSPALQKELAKLLSQSGTGSSALTTTVQRDKQLTYSGSGASLLTTLIGRTLTYAGTGAVTVARAVNRVLSLPFGGTGTSVLTRATQRLRSFTYGGTGSSVLARITDRLRSFTYSGTGTQVGDQVRVTLLDLSFTGSGTADAPVKEVGKPLAYSGTGGTVLSRAISVTRTFAYGGTGATTVAKGLSKALSFSGTGALATQAQFTILVGLSYAATGTATLAKQISKLLATGASGAVEIVKEVGKTLAYAANGSLVAAQAVSYNQAYSYSGVGTVVGEQNLGQIDQDLTYTGTGTVTTGPWSYNLFKSISGFGVPQQSNDGTPIDTGMQVGDDDWWRWRRMMWKRNRKE